MQTIYLIGFFVFGAVLTLIAAMTPRRSVLSVFELERRKSTGNQSAADELRRELLLEDVLSLKRVAEALMLVLTVLMSVGGFGWMFGVLTSVIVALFYGRIANTEMARSWANRIYSQIEPSLVKFVEQHPGASKILRSVVQSANEITLSSREELLHLVEASGHVLSEDEKRLVLNGIRFKERRVEDIMTPRGVITAVDSADTVGPLMLDELHKSGHSRFPVIKGDIDHVIGILHIRELLTLGDKKTKTAEEAMEKRVFYINQDQTLDQALAAFIKTRHHMFVVVNGYRETAGLLTLEDVMEALLGREIVDEYDVHDDLRVVADRNAKDNNNSPNGTNV